MFWNKKEETTVEEPKPMTAEELVAYYGEWLDAVPMSQFRTIKADTWQYHKVHILDAMNLRAGQFAIVATAAVPTLGCHLYGTEIVIQRVAEAPSA